MSARDEAPCFGSVAGLHRVLQRGDIEALVGTTLAPPASHSRSSASVGGAAATAAGAASAPSAAMTVAVTVPSACDCATAASAFELHGLLGRVLGHLRLQLLEERLRPTGVAAPLASTA